MIIQVNPKIELTPVFKKDKKQLVERINHPEIANNTLSIPYPYKSKDADFYFNLIKETQKAAGKQLNWAIRHSEEGMIGSIGLLGGVVMGNPARDAFGYWLWKKYWGQGIMTEVVEKFTSYCLTQGGLSRLEAYVFEQNIGSIKVLEKAGFEQEGFLKKAYLKNGEYLNSYLFAKTI